MSDANHVRWRRRSVLFYPSATRCPDEEEAMDLETHARFARSTSP